MRFRVIEALTPTDLALGNSPIIFKCRFTHVWKVLTGFSKSLIEFGVGMCVCVISESFIPCCTHHIYLSIISVGSERQYIKDGDRVHNTFDCQGFPSRQ